MRKARITQVKHVNPEKPINPDIEAIVTLLESIGYKVYGTQALFGTDNIRVLLKFDPKYANCVKRKIESRLPLKFWCGHRQAIKSNEGELVVTRCHVSIDRTRSIDGINDLLSTFTVKQ